MAVLSITRPTGGTIFGAAIVCGTAGNACTVAFPVGIVLGLEAVPDPGRTFLGWSAECPGGRVSLTGDRTCAPVFNGG